MCAKDSFEPWMANRSVLGKLHQSEEVSAKWGRLFFGYFPLAEQKKVTRPAGRNQSISDDANDLAKKPSPALS